MKYILWKLFGWSSFTQKQMDEIRANWFCVGESFGMNKTIDYLEKIGYTDAATHLRKELAKNDAAKGISLVNFETLRDYVRHAMDTE